MFDCTVVINRFVINENKLCLSVTFSCDYNSEVASPKAKVFFEQDKTTRRMPLPIKEYAKLNNSKSCAVECSYEYLIDKLFYNKQSSSDIKIRFDIYYGDEEYIGVPISISENAQIERKELVSFDFDNNCAFIKPLKTKKKLSISGILKKKYARADIVEIIRKPLIFAFRRYYKSLCRKNAVKQNRISFMSCRRNEMGGNLDCVYRILKDSSDIDFQFLLYSDPNGHKKISIIKRFLYLYATSRVVVVDDYFRLLNTVNKREGVKLYQLWHACGAFKTFGFSRLGKSFAPRQKDVSHRMYDCAIVSSREIAKHYAEGFGLSDECIAATGIPRTDVFMNGEYAEDVKEKFYKQHPQLKDKKIILFAPTFRGNGQMSAFYPLDKFSPEQAYNSLGGEYAIIIKLHPFCKERFEISKEYSDFIIDLSDEEELNDLLFVTDLLITDYSSVIFEASLLNIPMLFYAYDLDEYISSRDFYYEFKGFVPGKIVCSADELINSIKEKDFEAEKINDFKNKFFDSLDGKSSKRIADKILNDLSERKG